MIEYNDVEYNESDENKKVLYRTSDIYFASYLCSIDIDMVNTENDTNDEDGSNKLIFVFRIPKQEIGKLKASFFSGQATVKVRKFVDNLKALKSMVYT